MSAPRQVLVTGAAGFIGSHLSEHLFRCGSRLTIVDCLDGVLYSETIKRQNWESIRHLNGVRAVRGRLEDLDLEQLLVGHDAVVHLAALPGLNPSWNRFPEYVSSNIAATYRLLQAAVRADVRHFIHISTSSVYGEFALGGAKAELRPISPYGVSKLAAEHLVSTFSSQFGLATSTLRLFSVYGPRQRPDMAYHRIIEQILDRQPIVVFGDGHQTRTNTYVGDVVRAIDQTLSCGPQTEPIDISGREEASLLRAISEMERILDREARVEFAAPRLGDQRMTHGDTGQAERRLGFAATTTLSEGLERQVAWHLERRSLLS